MNCDDTELRQLIGALALIEPVISLGTPLLTDTPTTDALVACGARALPSLEAALAQGEARVAMYAAHCLGRIGDPAPLATLQATLQRYVGKLPKEAFDFGVIAAARQAVTRLGGVPSA